jgi:hypothetical protein
VPDEQYRLLWDNLPVWHRLKWLSNKFADHNACLVADTYTSAWCGAIQYIDPDHFLDSIAQAYTRIYLNIGIDQMADQVIDMIRFYDVNGLVMHSNRSCKPYSFGQMDIMHRVREQAGIPVLMLEADMVDPRSFSESQADTRIDAFMEIIRHKSDLPTGGSHDLCRHRHRIHHSQGGPGQRRSGAGHPHNVHRIQPGGRGQAGVFSILLSQAGIPEAAVAQGCGHRIRQNIRGFCPYRQ